MSIPVAVEALEKAMQEFGSAYLLTTSDARVKVVTVDPVVDGDRIRVGDPGGGTRSNLAGSAAVTLVFPPRQQRGYTLLVDGTGKVDGNEVIVTPASAVLHRPASHADSALPANGCGHDCAPVE